MKYETESCVLCEASASLLSKKIKNLPIKIIKEELNNLKEISLNNLNFIFPRKFKEFKFLINKNNSNRLNCIYLPIDASVKSFKIMKKILIIILVMFSFFNKSNSGLR
jgi:NifU-like protein involved in Fe-S cluster formation